MGRPVPNTTCFVLDSRLHPVPVGTVGELYLGGRQLARGYLNRPDLTNKTFLASPFASGERLYKTGDVVKYLADGSILYMGRNDDQVKIRGYRVELGEVESAMLVASAGAATQAKATVDDGNLVGFVSPASAPTDAIQLSMKSSIPSHMVPGRIIAVEQIPMSSAGKADTRALMALLKAGSASSASATMTAGSTVAIRAASPLEEAVLTIYREEIRSESLGVTSDFFESGGDSLKAVRVVSRLRSLCEDQPGLLATDCFQDVSVTDVFQNPTVRSLVASRAGSEGVLATPSSGSRAIVPRSPELRMRAAPASVQQEQMFVLAASLQNPAAYNVPWVVRLDGALQEDALLRAMDALTGRHDVLRSTLHPCGLSTTDSGAGVEQRFMDPSSEALKMRQVDVSGSSDLSQLWGEL
ncbi:MAG: AMP-binding protein, partial [Pontimonas sp.]|nr:AMP-binding protein [Pontimonas sp.]